MSTNSCFLTLIASSYEVATSPLASGMPARAAAPAQGPRRSEAQRQRRQRAGRACDAERAPRRAYGKPELTVAIRTNGVEAENAALYLHKLVRERLGVELSEEGGTLGRYIVAHVDRSRNLYFHPVLLEKLAKSNLAKEKAKGSGARIHRPATRRTRY